MATVTLAEAKKLINDDLVAGVIEDIVTVNPIFEVMPFTGITSNAIKYNRENAIGDVQSLAVGGTITAKAAATFTEVTTSLVKIIGDAEVDNLIQETLSDETDQMAYQISSKAKAAGRSFQSQMIVGDGTSNTFEGLLALCDSGQKTTPATDGQVLSFVDLDEMLDMITAKDGEVDYIQMHQRTIRAYKALLRALGGAGIGEVITMPSGKKLNVYSGVPIFRNDWIPINQTQGATSTCTTVMAGTFDDGSRKVGFAGLNTKSNAGVRVNLVGEKETMDETIARVKWYCSLALFSKRALAAIPGVTN